MTAPVQTRAQTLYASTAATAASLYAASKTTPEPIDTIKATMVSAADVTAAVTVSTSAAIIALWRRTRLADRRSVDRFLTSAGNLMISAQRSTAAVHTAAQLAHLKALGLNANVSVKIPDNVRGATVAFGDTVTVTGPETTRIDYEPDPSAAPDGAPVTREVSRAESEPHKLFKRAVSTYHHERATGADHATASTAAEQRIDELTETNVMLAQRLAEQQTLVKANTVDLDEEIIGYRRVIHPELSRGGTCGLCVAVSDRVYSLHELKPIHFRCNCTTLPITKTRDPGFRITREDLDMLYGHAGTTSGRTKGKNLKHTRYVIEDHAELGPVLRQVKGEKVGSLPAPDNRPVPDPFPETGGSQARSPRRAAGNGRRNSNSRTRTPRPPADTPEQLAKRQQDALDQLARLPEILIAQGLSPDSPSVRQARKSFEKLKAALAKAQAA